MDIANWLGGLGLEQYAQLFRDNDIDGEILCGMTAEDLKELGISSFGHRRRLLNAIAAFGSGDAAARSGPSSVPSGGSPLRNPPPPAGEGSHYNLPSPAGEGRVVAETEAERRQLTVMFCDLVGSTPLSTRFDPEDLREIVGAYHRCVTDTVARSGGFVAKYMGDGVLVYFGYPQAHEDDAERSARAGLAVIDAVGRLATQEPLQVRIGIATGLVVVGDLIGAGAAQERGVVGETPNLAARLQALARPGTLVVADSTRRQLGTLFEIEDLGPQPLAGFAEPQRAWRVAGESGVASRFEALRSGATPLVGRGEELDLLLRRWQQAKSGAGRVVLVSGEPGIGKSHLTAALSQHVESEPHTRLRYFCAPHHQASALYPFIGQLERAAGFARDDTTATRLDKLEALLGDGAEPGDISLIAEMLSLSGGERFPPLDLSPQRKKERTFSALLRQLQALARRQPVLMIFEDLHWLDPTSREVLDLTVEKTTGLPVLLIATYRPEFQPPWIGQSQVTVMALNRLGRNEGATLVHRLAGNLGALPPDVVDEIVERTDGVPLFVEELTKAVVEAGADRGDTVSAVPAVSLAVPATLHASLLGRLDRLGPAAKTVAQVGAAIGRDFSHELLAAVVQLGEPELQEALRRLVEAGLVFQRGMPPTAEYLFKHALVQDTAYSTLLRGPRQALHRRIAEALEQRFPDLVQTRPEIPAHYYGEAAMADKAIAYWHLAGKLSVTKSAMREAVAQLRQGLALVEALTGGHERAERELDLQVVLGPALYATEIATHPDIGRTYARARELCRQLGDPSREFTALRGLMLHYLNRFEMEKAQHFAEEALRVAERLDDAARFVGGHMALGATLFWQGKLELALTQFQRGFQMFDPNMQFPDWPGGHPGVSCQSFRMLISWMLGYPDRSLEQLITTIGSAERLGHAFTLAQTLCYAALLHVFRHEPLAVADYAGRALRICEEHRIAGFQGYALCAHGWALGVSGETEKGLAQIGQGVDSSGLGTVMQHSLLALQADAQVALGKPDAALESVAVGLKGVDEMGGGPLEAELYRLKGEALLAGAGTVSEAESAMQQGIDVARRQNAKSWELRGATSLARLLRDQGRRDEARDLVAPVYGWFTQGFDTADLKDARVLLDDLV
ncbi:MAG TPA: AAA family ATPase [Stellaceae bacterium]|nr:AAA family ATPase [Stellaceae bacterium]